MIFTGSTTTFNFYFPKEVELENIYIEYNFVTGQSANYSNELFTSSSILVDDYWHVWSTRAHTLPGVYSMKFRTSSGNYLRSNYTYIVVEPNNTTLSRTGFPMTVTLNPNGVYSKFYVGDYYIKVYSEESLNNDPNLPLDDYSFTLISNTTVIDKLEYSFTPTHRGSWYIEAYRKYNPPYDNYGNLDARTIVSVQDHEVSRDIYL